MADSSLDIDRLSFDELKESVIRLFEELTQVKVENQALREEIARLKGLKGKPDIKPPVKPSGMEENAKSRSGKKGGRNKPRRRGSKNDKLVIDETIILKPDTVPEGSIFKGYEDYVLQDLILRPRTVCYRRERWKTPDRGTIVAPLPDNVSGHFGPNLVRFLLAQYHKCQVTVPRLSEQVNDFGLSISERQVMRLLIKDKEDFLTEATNVLRAGLETAKWITVDDTGARHQGRNGYCTHIGNDHFAWFSTTASKSRMNFLELLRAGDEGFTINDAALDYMRDHKLSKSLVKRLGEHETRVFSDREAWMSHLQDLGFTELKAHPDPVRVATEAAMWGRITVLEYLRDAVIPDRGPGPPTPRASSGSAITPCAGSMASGWFTGWTPSAKASARQSTASGIASGGFTPISRIIATTRRHSAKGSCGGGLTASSRPKPALSPSTVCSKGCTDARTRC